MKAVRDKNLIQIEITNACINECANCTRFVGHHKEPYYMDLKMVEQALNSLKGSQKLVGIMGGEPTKHPSFVEICRLMQKEVPQAKRVLFTAGYKWDQYRSIIKKTFGVKVHLNNHKDHSQKHHPMLLAIKDMVPNQELAGKLINNCWVDQRWSPSINPKGCFFCEIAAAQDILFEGPGGLPIKKGWWKKPPHYFADQIKRHCYRCGAPVPFHSVFIKENKDYVSISNFNRLKDLKTPRFIRKRVKLIQDCYSEKQLQKSALGWEPWNHSGKDGRMWLNHYELYGRFGGFTADFPNNCWKKINRLKKVGKTAFLSFLKKKSDLPVPY